MIAGLVGGGSAVLAAGLATVGTYKVTDRSVKEAKAEGDRQRQADEKERQLDRQHAWDLAAEERQQQRRRDAYVAIQTYVTGWINTAQWRIRPYETDPPTPAPETTLLEAETIATAELQASEQVIEALTDFTKKTQLFLVAIGGYRRAEEMADPQLPGSVNSATELREHMESRGNDLLTAGESIRQMMRDELAGKCDRNLDGASVNLKKLDALS